MEQPVEWQVVAKGKPKKMGADENAEQDISVTIGETTKLANRYTLWSHDIQSKDWTLAGYRKMITIDNASHFWRVINNLDKLGYRSTNLFLMKEGIDPIWEHPSNRDGGTCSFKIDMDRALAVYEDLCVRMVCNSLTPNSDDINGIAFGPKSNYVIIKIWNGDKKNDLSVTLNQEVLNRYKNASIKYKDNTPEY